MVANRAMSVCVKEVKRLLDFLLLLVCQLLFLFLLGTQFASRVSGEGQSAHPCHLDRSASLSAETAHDVVHVGIHQWVPVACTCVHVAIGARVWVESTGAGGCKCPIGSARPDHGCKRLIRLSRLL